MTPWSLTGHTFPAGNILGCKISTIYPATYFAIAAYVDPTRYFGSFANHSYARVKVVYLFFVGRQIVTTANMTARTNPDLFINNRLVDNGSITHCGIVKNNRIAHHSIVLNKHTGKDNRPLHTTINNGTIGHKALCYPGIWSKLCWRSIPMHSPNFSRCIIEVQARQISDQIHVSLPI